MGSVTARKHYSQCLLRYKIILTITLVALELAIPSNTSAFVFAIRSNVASRLAELMPSPIQVLVELRRALMYMQLPIVGFLTIASFQTRRLQGKGPFALAGYGWVFNLGYISLSSTLEFLNATLSTGPAVTPFQVEALASLLDSITGACFMLAYLAPHEARPFRSRWLGSTVVAVIALAVGSWLSDLLALQQLSVHTVGFIVLSTPLVVFSFVARLSLGKALFERTKIEVPIGQGPTQFYVACWIYALIQPLYLLRQILPQSQTIGFFLGFVAKGGIAFGFVKLFSALSSKYASEQRALDTARTILGRIRHELNTPLGELKNWIDAAKPDAPGRKFRQQLQHMESATQRALAITAVRDDVLYDVIEKPLPSIEETARPSKEIVNINTLLQTAIIAVKTTRSEDVAWSVNFAAGNCIQCSREQVIQIFVNVLRNACDALRDSKGRISVTTTQILLGKYQTEEEERFVKVSIRDNGEGFDDSIREIAFTDGFTTRDGSDRGHGLVIVRHLLAANNGSIEVTSPVYNNDKERPGTEMILIFPKVRCHDGDSGSTDRT